MFDNINNQPANGQNNQNGFNNPPNANGGYNPAAGNLTPGSVSGGLTDMYAETDRSEKPDAFKPKQDSDQFNQGYDNIPPEMLATSGGTKQKIITLLIVIIGMVILGAGGYYGFKFYKNNFSPKTDISTPENIDIDASQTATENSNANDQPSVIPTATSTEESDSNTENTEPLTELSSTTPENLATTTEDMPVTNLDTDQDGLTDSEEAALGTSPTNVDTDADGLSDRQEVQVYKTNPLNPDTDGDGFNDGDEVSKGYDPNGPGKLYDINDQN
jgi:hypothetical protein